jgi:DNA-binding response OmpR family regulator
LLQRRRRFTAITERVVDNQVARLRQKIEPNPDSPRILLTELGVGYRLAQPGEIENASWTAQAEPAKPTA